MRILYSSILPLMLLMSPGCVHRKKKLKTSQMESVIKEPHNITVFVHGTLPPDFFFQFPFVHNFFYCPQGLSLVHALDKKYKLSNFKIMTQADPEQFHPDTFYFFGWSGDLNHKARYKAAQDLYAGLQELRKKHGPLPFTIITQSHGGNVALNLVPIAQENDAQELCIEKLVLLACPVQETTAPYVHAPFFKNIYALYSPIDVIQIADQQGFLKFSDRHFPKDDKLIHCRLRLNGRGMGHSDFLFKPFLKNLPTILKDLETPEKRVTLKKVKKMDEYIIRIYG